MLSGTGTTRTFTMHAHHVSVVAVFKETTTGIKGLKAVTQNGVLYLSGLSTGQPFSVYNITGTLIYQSAANSDKAEISLPNRGVYIVASGGKTVKVVN